MSRSPQSNMTGMGANTEPRPPEGSHPPKPEHARLFGGLHRRLADFVRDRRGATAVLFGVSAVVVVGMVGLGTEGGSWYVTKRDAQNAADTAAYAGAVRLSMAQSSLALGITPARVQALDTARDTSTRNGFTTGTANATVSPATPPATGPNTANITAVEVIVQRTRPRLISSLFLGGSQVVAARGVAALLANGSACMLAIPGFGTGTVTGQLLAGGNSSVSAPSCVLASNSNLAAAVSITGSAAITALSITSTGGCVGCSAATVTQAVSTYAPPSTNPLAYLNNKVLPTFNNGSCYLLPVYTPAGVVLTYPNSGRINESMVVPPPPTGRAICGMIITAAGTVVTLNPGVYYFYNSSFRVASGTVECRVATSPPRANGRLCANGEGVTLVFTGDPGQIGGPDINGNAIIKLSAPNAVHATDPDYAGILFFRDPRATGGNTQGNPAVNINGGANTVLTGAMYFPNSYVKYNGNANLSLCSVLIGGTIEMTGNAGLTIAQCAALGFANLVPQIQIVRLVE